MMEIARLSSPGAFLARLAAIFLGVVIPNGGLVRCPQEGNLISIGPGMYPSNRTLDGGGRSILVLGSCEFMHNGTLTGLNYYVASADWMVLQIWRPVSVDAVSMMLVYERMIEPNASVDDITQLRFEPDELHVLEGDRIGFTKLNHTFPIPYVFNPQMSADLWYNRVPPDVTLPLIGDVITFEEMGFPYHFSVTVTFKAQVSGRPAVLTRPLRPSPKHADVSKERYAKGEEARKPQAADANAVYKVWGETDKLGAGLPVGRLEGIPASREEGEGEKAVAVGDMAAGEMEAEATSANLTLAAAAAAAATWTEASDPLEDSSSSSSSRRPALSTSRDPHSPPPPLAQQGPPHSYRPDMTTAAGPRFIFNTVMQTFSDEVQTTDDPAVDDNHDGNDVNHDTEVTSELTSSDDDVDDAASWTTQAPEADSDVTTEATWGVHSRGEDATRSPPSRTKD